MAKILCSEKKLCLLLFKCNLIVLHRNNTLLIRLVQSQAQLSLTNFYTQKQLSRLIRVSYDGVLIPRNSKIVDLFVRNGEFSANRTYYRPLRYNNNYVIFSILMNVHLKIVFNFNLNITGLYGN